MNIKSKDMLVSTIPTNSAYYGHILNCKNKDHISCEVGRDYFPFTDVCPVDSNSHEGVKDACKLWKNDTCYHAKSHEVFGSVLGTYEPYWHYNYKSNAIRILIDMRRTHENMWVICVGIGENETISEKVARDFGFQSRTEFNFDDMDNLKKLLKFIYSKRKEIYEKALDEYKCSRCHKVDSYITIYGKNRFCEGCINKIATSWERDFRIKCLWKGCDGIINITKETYSASMPKSEGTIQECGWMVHTLVCPKCGNSVGNIDIGPDGWVTYAPDGKHTDESKIGIHVKKVIDGKEKQVMIEIKKESKRRYLKEWARPWTKKEHEKWKKDIAKEKERDSQ